MRRLFAPEPHPRVPASPSRAALVGPHGAPVAAYREQTVEIALGPKGAFENDNIGTLTRRVAADRVVHAVPSRVLHRKPAKAPRTPRVVEHLSPGSA